MRARLSIPVLLVLPTWILLAGCGGDPVSDDRPPPGRWEYRGPLINGSEAVARIQISSDSFIRFAAIPAPKQKLDAENHGKFLRRAEAGWNTLPEMMVAWDGKNIIGIGSDVDGVTLFEYLPDDDAILSHQRSTGPITLRRVESFTPFAFPVYERDHFPERTSQ